MRGTTAGEARSRAQADAARRGSAILSASQAMITVKQILITLIGQLEAATGPDREIDLAIGLALEAGENNHPVNNPGEDAPLYTASIEAALTLVPVDCLLVLSCAHDNWHAALNQKSIGKPGVETATAATPTLAICIAAVKARLI